MQTNYFSDTEKPTPLLANAMSGLGDAERDLENMEIASNDAFLQDSHKYESQGRRIKNSNHLDLGGADIKTFEILSSETNDTLSMLERNVTDVLSKTNVDRLSLYETNLNIGSGFKYYVRKRNGNGHNVFMIRMLRDTESLMGSDTSRKYSPHDVFARQYHHFKTRSQNLRNEALIKYGERTRGLEAEANERIGIEEDQIRDQVKKKIDGLNLYDVVNQTNDFRDKFEEACGELNLGDRKYERELALSPRFIGHYGVPYAGGSSHVDAEEDYDYDAEYMRKPFQKTFFFRLRPLAPNLVTNSVHKRAFETEFTKILANKKPKKKFTHKKVCKTARANKETVKLNHICNLEYS